MRHAKAVAWEKKLKEVFDEIDREMEAAYGGKYPLHPARAPDGSTANPEHSGLFNVGAAFTSGFGSTHGPGYVVDIDLATLSDVPGQVREEIQEAVAVKLRERLPAAFPDRKLLVEREGHRYKIHGDLALGEV